MDSNRAAIEQFIGMPLDSLFLLYCAKLTRVVSITSALLEVISTLPEEVELIWPSKLSPMKLVFFANKYSVLVDTILAVKLDITTYEPKACAVQYELVAYCYIGGVLFSEVILLIRTVALWSRNKYVLALLLGAASEMVPFTVYVVYTTLQSTIYASSKVVRIIGCVPSTQDQDMWPAYLCMILAESGIVGLTILKQYLEPITSSSALFAIMYHDGLFFFAIVLFMSIINVLVMLLAPRELSSSMQMPLRVIHSALCTRVLLNLRKAGRASLNPELATIPTTTVKPHSTLVFDAGSGAPAGGGSRRLSMNEDEDEDEDTEADG